MKCEKCSYNLVDCCCDPTEFRQELEELFAEDFNDTQLMRRCYHAALKTRLKNRAVFNSN